MQLMAVTLDDPAERTLVHPGLPGARAARRPRPPGRRANGAAGPACPDPGTAAIGPGDRGGLC